MSPGALWILALVVLVLAVPVAALCLAYAARCKRMAWRASRAARQASQSALETSISSRLAVADAERALRLLNAARTRAAETADADVAEQLGTPLAALPLAASAERYTCADADTCVWSPDCPFVRDCVNIPGALEEIEAPGGPA